MAGHYYGGGLRSTCAWAGYADTDTGLRGIDKLMKKLLIKLLLNADRAYRMLQRMIYRFDKWHTRPPFEKDYLYHVANEIDRLGTEKRVLDIACGTGDLVFLNEDIQRYVGVDPDEGAIAFAKARFKSKPGQRRSFTCDPATIAYRFEIFVCVNMLHTLSESEAKELITRYLKQADTNCWFIFDVSRHPESKHQHCVEHLFHDHKIEVENIAKGFERERSVITLKILKGENK